MIIKIVALLFGVLVILLTGLYLLLFSYKWKKRDKPQLPLDYERIRAQDYPPPFPNGWFNLCSSSEIKKGQVKEVNALGKRLAVFRGQDGKVGVVNAVCPHLGANLADGCVKEDFLVCPFHGWQFDQTGKCVHIPYSERAHNNPNTTAESWHVMENWGLILAWYHSE